MDKEFKITAEDLKKILSETNMKFSIREIEEIMDAEIEKPEEEMDTELIDLCASVLCKHYGIQPESSENIPMFKPWETAQETVKRKPRIKLIKILPIAAVLMILLVIALPVGAKLVPSETSDSIIEFYVDHFKLNMLKEDTTISDNWVHSLISENLDKLALPKVLVSDDYQKKFQIEEGDNLTITYISIANTITGIDGNIIVTQYTDENSVVINSSVNVSNMYRNFKQMSVDGIDVFVFGDDKQMYISYVESAISYEIILNCRFDEAILIAETIKK